MVFVYCIVSMFVALAAVCLIRTALAAAPSAQGTFTAPKMAAGEQAAQRLSGGIQIRTVSYEKDEQIDTGAFYAFHDYIEREYPKVHGAMQRETVDGCSLLYRWEGNDPALEPCLLLAHIDVVPVDAATEGEWTHPPFSGKIADGYVWGRGTLDMKGQLFAVLEACEALIEEGFTPQRDVYLAFGHNEERLFSTGAQSIAKLLQSRAIRFFYVLDEGGGLTRGEPFGANAEFACIGVAEKVYVDLRISATAKGGHASTPPKHTALGEIARAITRLEKSPMRARLAGPARDFLKVACGHMPFLRRLPFANMFLFGALIKRHMCKDPAMAALLRTTIAPTMASASIATNVLPQRASAVLNVRIAPWQNLEDVLAHVRRVCGPEIEVEVMYASEPSGVASVRSAAYAHVAASIERVFSGFCVAPTIMVGASDARFYSAVCQNVLRFVPFRSAGPDSGGVHGVNERLELKSFSEGVTFYTDLIRHS